MEKQYRTQKKFLTLLNDITRAALDTQDLATMANILADCLGELYDASGCYITLWDQKTKTVRPTAAYGNLKATYTSLQALPGEQTVTESVLQAGQPLIIEDVHDSPHLGQHFASLFPGRSLLGLPLVAGDKQLGAALVGFAEHRNFTLEEINWGEQAAAHMSLAIAQVQLLLAEREQRKLAESLREIGSALNSTLDHEQVLRLILQQLSDVVPYDSASVMLLTGKHLEMAAHRSLHPSRPSLMPSNTQTLPHIQKLLTGQFPTIIPDTTQDPHWQQLDATQHIRCWLGAPLMIRDQIIGLLNLNKEEPNFYSERDAQAAQIFAVQAAVAIENARLYRKLYKRMNELSQTQAQLIRSSWMAAAGEIAAGIAHDINNPLTGILGMAQVLARTTDSPEQKQDLDEIVEQARRLARVVRGLQEFASDPHPVRQAADINQILQETIPFIQGRARRRGVRIVEELAPNLPWPIINMHQLRQLFLSLMSRALYVMSGGGTLTLATQLELQDQKEMVAISFHDTGPAIPPERINDLFEVIFDPDAHSLGLTLGLVASRAIARDHGGEIKVTSTADQGTTLTVYFPYSGK